MAASVIPGSPGSPGRRRRLATVPDVHDRGRRARGSAVLVAVAAVASGALLGTFVVRAVAGGAARPATVLPAAPARATGDAPSSAPGSTTGAAPGVGGATGVMALTASVAVPAPAGATRFVPLAPHRLLDTRTAGGRPADGGVVRLAVGGDATVPDAATAVVLNLTVTDAAGPGYVTAWPTGLARPVASNLNVDEAGRTVANLVVVPLGAGRAVDVFVQRSADVVADVLGAFVPASSATAGRLQSERPRRVLDTRGDRAFAPGETRTVDLGEQARGAAAAVVNLTATDAAGPGYVTAWADGQPRPATSNLNIDHAGQTVANLAVVPLHDGRLQLASLAATHLVVDVAGLFTGAAAPDDTEGLFVPLAPSRVVDTRAAQPLGRLTGGYRADVALTGAAGVPADGVGAVLLNATATETSLPGFLTVYPTGTAAPLASTVNADRSWQTVPNLVVARLGAGGAVSVLPQHTGHLVVDVLGWFTGTPQPAEPGVPTAPAPVPTPTSGGPLVPTGAISGAISPKSVVVTGGGLLFAQNMMYTHTITVYDRAGGLLATIADRVDLAAFGAGRGVQQGAPVEAAVAADGRHVYVSNYSMYGPGAGPEGFDACVPNDAVGDSTVYRVDVSTLAIDQVIGVGKVPKFMAASPDGRWLVVSNWCGDDVSVVDLAVGREVRRVHVGRNPRGLAITADSATAFVALMGDGRLAVLDLATGAVGLSGHIGGGTRHLNLSPDGRWLYVTLNEEGGVAKVDTATLAVVARVATGTQPRSASLAADGRHLYVVNYESASASRIRTDDFVVDAVVPTAHHPIGISYDSETRQLFVACYDGRILLFRET